MIVILSRKAEKEGKNQNQLEENNFQNYQLRVRDELERLKIAVKRQLDRNAGKILRQWSADKFLKTSYFCGISQKCFVL